MHDYQLERLNTRSFEQLIQALGLEIIGKQLMIFGDGPDGGREATFDGPTKYPEGGSQWNGYGMVQAKFRQHPDSAPKKNADWAIVQLKAEFSKLEPRPKQIEISVHGERICPEFYIFATNLSLSPVAKGGGKDRVRTVLDGFKKTHGLRDYAIWDGDQIRRFLDAQPSIRATYAAWLLPGDVLVAMLEHLKLARTDFSSTILRYLEIELLDDQYAKLGQGGYTDANAIPLSNAFVDLPVDMPTERETREDLYEEIEGDDWEDDQSKVAVEKRISFLELFLEEGRQVLKPSSNTTRSEENLHSRRTAGRIVLIGGPGQGKTTVGQFACQLLRAALLNSTKANFSPEVVQALTRIGLQSQDLPKTHVLRYPLRVDLKRLAEALAGEGDFAANSLLDYLVRHISKRTDSDLSKIEFRIWLQSYPWLLVLDGLDEVPASSNRTKVMNAIRDFVSVEAHQQDADLLILATTRPQGYSDEFDSDLYCHLPLAPLNATEALEYGNKLAVARHPGLKSRIEELTRSLKRATTNPATVRLMESPLQVTIMLALIEGGGEPPEQRWKLFHDYYDVIYRREKERGTPFSGLLGKYEPEIHWLHHRAGWILQQRNATAGATAARLTHAEFEKMVDSRLLKRGHHDATQRGSLVTQIREAATDRLVFLVGNTAKEIGFEIRSLQEFMAAEHCFDGPESCVHATIRTIAPYPYWRNVFLFVAGRIFFEKESLIDSLIAVCERLNETLTDSGHGTICAGSRLALAMLKDGVARNQPENSRVLARCSAKLLDGLLPNEMIEVVELFTGETGAVWEEELSKRLRKVGTEFPHIPWRICLQLVGANNEFATGMMLSEFPWKHREVNEFISGFVGSSGVIPNRFWVNFREHIFTHPPTVWRRSLRRSNLPESLGSDLLAQLARIYRSEHESGDVPLLDDAGQATCNRFRIQGSRQIDRWAALIVPPAALEAMHPTWRAYHAISEFARAPSSSNLAKQIAVILEGELEKAEVPWQVRVCIEAMKAGLSLDRIVEFVTAGSIGHAEDWARWESTEQSGVKISALGCPEDAFLISDDHQGIIYGDSGWHHHHQAGDFDFAAAVTHSLPRLRPDSPVVRSLVNVCCFGLNSAGSDWSPECAATVESFVTCCNDLKIPMSREIIVAVIKSSLDLEVKVRLLGVIGIGVDRWSWLHEWAIHAARVDASCKIIVDAMKKSGSPVSVLGAISFLPPLPFSKELPAIMLEKCRCHDELHRQAATALHINGLVWEKSGVEVAADALDLQSRYPHHLEELLEFIDAQGVSSNDIEAFLIALIRAPESVPKLSSRGELMDLLVKIVERRPAIDSLPDPSALISLEPS